MCFGASLCVVRILDVYQSMANMQPCCLSFVSRHMVELVVLMHTVSCDFSPLSLHPRGSHVTVLYHDDEGEENAGSSNLQGGSSPGRYSYHFLSFSLPLLSHPFFTSVSTSPSPLFLTSSSFHPFIFSFCHT